MRRTKQENLADTQQPALIKSGGCYVRSTTAIPPKHAFANKIAASDPNSGVGPIRNIFPHQALALGPTFGVHVMLKLSAVASMVMIMAPPAIAYTQKDADACTPDAMRFCQNAIPDAGRVTLCLVKNKRQLSLTCAVVFNRLRGATVVRELRENIQKTNF